MKFIITIACLSSLISATTFSEVSHAQSAPPAPGAAPVAETRPALAYPELQVSPRASERIAMEARTEASTRRTQLLPLQISALSTLLAGALAPKPSDPVKAAGNDVNDSRKVAMGVGATWLIFSYFFNEEYSPYTKAQAVLKNLPTKTAQDELVRERIAQEHIEGASSLGKKITWASVLTNLAATAYLAGQTEKEGAVYAGVAGVLALGPLVFPDRWQTVNSYHQDYKKRIYAPIAMPTLLLAPQSGRSTAMVPGFTWQMGF